jgi:hypothetical protein
MNRSYYDLNCFTQISYGESLTLIHTECDCVWTLDLLFEWTLNLIGVNLHTKRDTKSVQKHKKGHVRTEHEDALLQVKGRNLGRNQSCQHGNLRL